MSVLIPLYQRGAVAAHAIVDDEDAAALGQHHWLLSAHGYAVRYTDAGRTCIRMQREILGLPQGDPRQSDHVNRDRLDNRRSNLRIVTSAENSQNVSSKGSTSNFRGVHFDRQTGRWRARVKIAGVVHNLGRFTTEGEAASAAAAFRAKHMPFAVEGAS